MEGVLCVQVLLYMLSRTMDFSIEMAKTVTYIPQNFHLIHDYSSSEMYQIKYAYVGMGALEDHCNIVFDGVNEQGLTAATLYFVNYANYADPQTSRYGCRLYIRKLRFCKRS